MSFGDATAYDQFMGRYSRPLSAELLRLVDLLPTQRALDVGCGPGALTELLVDALGSDLVHGVDPSAAFIAAARLRLPGVTFTEGRAERLPYEDNAFDIVLAQLVVHFMSDPIKGLNEMHRVARHGGLVGATVWDHAGGSGPLSPFWRAVREIHHDERGESQLPGTSQGELEEFFVQAGFSSCDSRVLTVSVSFDSFEEWWAPYTLGVGPAGSFVAGLSADEVATLREHCRSLFPTSSFEVSASAWCVTATA